MIKRKKILIFIAGLITLFIILLGALQLLAPRIMNLEATKVKIRQVVLEKTGGELSYDRIGISILPRPGIELERVTYSLPSTLKGTVDSAELNAKLLPLFKGKVVVSRIRIYGPSFSITVARGDKKQAVEEERVTADHVKRRLRPFMAALASAGPGRKIEIHDGTVAIDENEGPVLSFRNLDVTVATTAGVIRADIKCGSSIADHIALTLKLDPEKSALQGDVNLKKAQLKSIFDRFYEPASRYVGDSVVDLRFGLEADAKKINIKTLNGSTGRSTISNVNAQIDLSQEKPSVRGTMGLAEIDLTELNSILSEIKTVNNELKDLRSVEGMVALAVDNIEGPLLDPSQWDFKARGSMKNVRIDSDRLPEQVTIPEGTFEATPRKITFNNVRAVMLDTDVTGSGMVANYIKGRLTAGLNINGDVGIKTSRWVNGIAELPPRFNIDHSFTIKKVRFDWSGNRIFSLNGQFSVSDDLSLDVDARYDQTGINIKKLELKDNESNALIALNAREKELRLKFSGNITNSTLSKLMVMDKGVKGWVKGVFDTKIPLDHPERFIADGNLEGEHIIVPVTLNEEVELKKISLKAAGDTVTVSSSEVALGNHVLTARGDVKGSQDGFIVNADVSSAGLSWEDIERLFAKDDKDKERDEQGPSDRIPIKGTVRAHSDIFSYDSYRWEPVDATITFDRDTITLAVNNAVICNISTPGTVTIADGEIGIDFMVASKNSPFGDSLVCFTGKDEKVTGTFDIEGKVAGRATVDQLIRSLKGDVKLSVRDGVIYEQTFFTKVFAVINVTEVFRGNYADIGTNGFTYNSMYAKADISNGKIHLDEMTMDGSTMDMVGSGEIDLTKKMTDATFIVAPLKTVNAVVRMIPILSNITGGTLITVALKVTGQIGDPKVLVVPPSTVGEGLVGMMKRTFQLPFKILGLDDIGQKNPEEKEQSK